MHTYYVGQPVIHEDMANYRKGWIAEVKENEANTFMMNFDGRGLTPIMKDITVVWEEDTFSTQLSEEIIDRYAEKAERYELEGKTAEETLALLQKAKDAQTARMNKAAESRAKAEAERQAWLDEHLPKVPTWAKAVLVGELIQDESDSMTDYYGSTTKKTVLLAFSKHTRDLFPEMRKAAANHPSTAHLVDANEEAEHREKWSMGGGYYLKDGFRHSSGWQVRKVNLSYCQGELPYGEWCIPSQAEPKTANSKKVSTPRKHVTEITIEDGTKPGYIEISFPDKPDVSVRDALKQAGYRWAKKGVWYGKDVNLPELVRNML